ncbi:hypothetical protein DL89DRAFT_266528 [Linderina pennispora]|uniref:Uncharacterized protein n=1 Tax=Linderina pennispora TaxID=61395 RepID=A0A1Y1WEC7_9FUNG|nr:uncharacterized protein DL89DRAFT_266528 [Linderina pennispora]ORX71514.1 hypothetical protein DL89DRAFT_266528 [Linderina pennispora]
MDIDQADNQLVVIPQVDIAGLCASSLYPGSTYMEYTRIMDFAKANPHRARELPDSAFSVLFIHCRVEDEDAGPLLKLKYPREWLLNLQFLIDHGKLDLVTEVRVAMYDESQQLLELDTILKDIAVDIGRPLPNVHSILYLGKGIFTAGQNQTIKNRKSDAEETVKLIRHLFPQVNDLKYHLYNAWFLSVGHTTLPDDANPLYELTFEACVEQLEHLQLHNPIPTTITKFPEHVVSLSINADYVRGRPDLPPVATDCLRVLYLLNSTDVFPWQLFRTSQGRFVFDCLEELSLQFTRRADNLVAFPGGNIHVSFPNLNTLQVSGACYVYHNLYAFFQECSITAMQIVDKPSDFSSINQHTLEAVKRLIVGHPLGKVSDNSYSSASVEHLFMLPANIEKAKFTWFRWPLPLNTAWINLRDLSFSANIATKSILANLIVQLPVLQLLNINCVTMVTDNVDKTVFSDEVSRITKFGQILDPLDDSSISDSVEEFEIMVQEVFDIEGFCELISRLPKVSRIKVHPHWVQDVQNTLRHYFEVTRIIDISAYPQVL